MTVEFSQFSKVKVRIGERAAARICSLAWCLDRFKRQLLVKTCASRPGFEIEHFGDAPAFDETPLPALQTESSSNSKFSQLHDQGLLQHSPPLQILELQSHNLEVLCRRRFCKLNPSGACYCHLQKTRTHCHASLLVALFRICRRCNGIARARF